MSWLNTVAVAISAPLEVDITAASAAASTRPASTGGSCISTNCGEGVVAGLQRRQQHLGRHPDHRAGDRVQQAVHAGRGAGPAGHAGAARGEHPLPDVLADQQAEGVDDEVGQDGARRRSRSARSASAGSFSASPPKPPAWISGDRQQDEEDADGLDDELHEVGQRDRPHAAEHGVDDHDAPPRMMAGTLPMSNSAPKMVRVGDGRGDRQHQRVAPHDDAGEHAGAGAVAQFQHLADGVDAQPLDPAGEQQAQQARMPKPMANTSHMPEMPYW